MELVKLLPDARAPVRVRQRGPLARRVPSLLSSRLRHIHSANSVANSYMSFSTPYSDTDLWGTYFVLETWSTWATWYTSRSANGRK